MDLKQRKLSKSEWQSLEILVSQPEMEILKLIIDGFHTVNIKYSKNISLFGYLKIEYSEKMEEYLYVEYFSKKINELVSSYSLPFLKVDVNANVTIKKADKIRISQLDGVNFEKLNIYEFVLLKELELLFQNKYKNKNNDKNNDKNKDKNKNNDKNKNKEDLTNENDWIYHYFTLYKLIKYNIIRLNKYIKEVVLATLNAFETDINLLSIIRDSTIFIEKNANLLKYDDMMLYDHQKEIFTIAKSPSPKLILYIAPTGTGKTLTPLGLSEKYKVIFVCAARHVGLALAKAAISMNKKIAIGFGCGSADDIRLHYFAAKEYSVNKRSGGIGKVDNSIGDKVEIMICDIKSYISAMYYMLAFNQAENILTYWDEPTITMDYKEHELHQVIHNNWTENLIPNFVLSSATLPKIHEIPVPIQYFMEKFPDAQIHNIVSHDCRKTIPMINNSGYVVMPHYMHQEYEDILKIVDHIEENLTLLRYFDLEEASNFIHFCETNKYTKSNTFINRNFGSLDDINMKNIKMHYLKVIKNIIPGTWGAVYLNFKINRSKRIISNDAIDIKGNKLIQKFNSIGPGVQSNTPALLSGQPIMKMQSEQIVNANNDDKSSAIYITTKDAFTLTDGPTIFIATDVQKIAKFCIQQANIPNIVMKDIMDKIEFNNNINDKINALEQEIETELEKQTNKEEKDSGGQQKSNKDKKGKSKMLSDKMGKTKDKRIIQLQEQIELCRSMIKNASLDDVFIPNKLLHKQKWAEGLNTDTSFTSDIDEDIIVSIMLLKDVEDSWKVLLLLGIGVFTTHKSIAYTEIMKKLADQQKLYIIIADSDYIYGTNYQFCHGYLSKDLNLTQEKIIQAMGRIGRNNIQQEYSIRFRDDEQIKVLFTSFASEDKPEVVNMNLLLSNKKKL